jgi:class 3 adenylate cyclase
LSYEWQRRIDHIQSSQGVHIGISVGDVEIVRLRPFSRTHLSAVSDTINLASRLTQAAASSEIVISNSFFQRLDYEHRAQFHEIDMVEARNLGKIKAWKRDASALSQTVGRA